LLSDPGYSYQHEFEIYEQSYFDCLDANQGAELPGPEEICDSDTSVQALKPNTAGIYRSIFQLAGNDIAYNEQSKIDILSHIIPARTEPLGQQAVAKEAVKNTEVEITDNFALLGLTNSNQDHSAPFHGYYSQLSPRNRELQRAAYWNTVLSESLNLIPQRLNDLTGLNNNIVN